MQYREKQKRIERGELVIKDTDEIVRKILDKYAPTQYEFYKSAYESDAQLTAYYKKGRIDAVYTSDTDLLVYGVKKVLFPAKKKKYQSRTSMVDEYDLDKLHTVQNCKEITHIQFQIACILCGCDYFIPDKRCNFQKAVQRAISHYRPTTIDTSESKIMRSYYMGSYWEGVLKALLTFNFQVVYDPSELTFVYLNDPNTHPLGNYFYMLEDRSFLGEPREDSEMILRYTHGGVDHDTYQEYRNTKQMSLYWNIYMSKMHKLIFGPASPSEKPEKPTKPTKLILPKPNTNHNKFRIKFRPLNHTVKPPKSKDQIARPKVQPENEKTEEESTVADSTFSAQTQLQKNYNKQPLACSSTPNKKSGRIEIIIDSDDEDKNIDAKSTQNQNKKASLRKRDKKANCKS